MPAPLLLLPALVMLQSPFPAPAKPAQAMPAIDPLQERLEAIPESYMAGKRGGMKRLVAEALTDWDRLKPELRKALPEADVTAIDRQFKAMRTMTPREQAVGALGISGILNQHQPPSLKQDLQRVDRTTMLAWLLVDAGQAERLPNLAEAFKPIIDKDKGQHTLVLAKVRETLKRLETAQKRKQKAGCKKALVDLLSLIDQLEKP